MSNRRTLNLVVVILGVAVTLGGVAVWLTSPAQEAAAQSSSSDGVAIDAQKTATVSRGSLSTDREFNAAVSHGDSWTINTTTAGTITSARDVGSAVDFGQELIRIDDKPVTLAAGSMPMYRELRKVDTRRRDANGNRLKRQTGEDVAQLQRFLIEAGYDDDGRLEVDSEFGPSTEEAVEDWQKAVGLPVSGRIDSAQIVFEPGPVRINSSNRVGDGFTGLEVTGSGTEVLVDTSTRDRSALPVGDSVEIDVNGETMAGVITEQEQITSPDGSRVWRTTVVPGAKLSDDVSVAKVTVTQTVTVDTLLVPVVALLALSEGGFAVEVPDGAATRLVAVDVGEVLDGQAEISGDVAEGDEVVIPE